MCIDMDNPARQARQTRKKAAVMDRFYRKALAAMEEMPMTEHDVAIIAAGSRNHYNDMDTMSKRLPGGAYSNFK
jgi:non-ribosomal peptide synthetase component E (peptide arylation enzyme)